MRIRNIVLTLLAALLLLGLGVARAAEGKTGGLWGLAVWEGKLPGGSVDGKTPREFWQEPGLRSAAERDLGSVFVKKLIEDPTLRYWDDVKRYNQILVASYCVQRSCKFNNIFLFIDMDKGEISACVHGMAEFLGLGTSLQADVHEDLLFGKGQIKKIGYDSCWKMNDALRSGKK